MPSTLTMPRPSLCSCELAQPFHAAVLVRFKKPSRPRSCVPVCIAAKEQSSFGLNGSSLRAYAPVLVHEGERDASQYQSSPASTRLFPTKPTIVARPLGRLRCSRDCRNGDFSSLMPTSWPTFRQEKKGNALAARIARDQRMQVALTICTTIPKGVLVTALAPWPASLYGRSLR